MSASIIGHVMVASQRFNVPSEYVQVFVKQKINCSTLPGHKALSVN